MADLFDDEPFDPGTGSHDVSQNQPAGSSAPDAGGPAPLAERMRPRTLDEYVGQQKILGAGRPLRRAIEQDTLQSIILWGPPGTGKTTLARLIASATKAKFVQFSAVLSGVKEIRAVMAEAEETRRRLGRRTILFVDEIHRFNKSQQDAFLPRVEAGDIVLIGATTENPSFEVNSALLSRSKVFVLEALKEQDLVAILQRALADTERGLGKRGITADENALVAIARYANGDGRIALNMLEMLSAGAAAVHVTRERLADLIERRSLLYDKGGEEHFNIISALHKSMRNSDPDASVYWLARMIEAGEDALYIARRIVRFASEDIGNADPQALTVAIAAKDAVHFMGMPEGNTALAQAAIYMATAPKSNAVYAAYNEAKEDAEQQMAEPVPHHLRNAPTKLMKALDYGKGYQYAHNEAEGVADMQCLPDSLKDKTYYRPTDRGFERGVRERLESARAISRRTAPAPGRPAPSAPGRVPSGTSRDEPEG